MHCPDAQPRAEASDSFNLPQKHIGNILMNVAAAAAAAADKQWEKGFEPAFKMLDKHWGER